MNLFVKHDLDSPSYAGSFLGSLVGENFNPFNADNDEIQ